GGGEGKATARLSRDHVIATSGSGLVTVTGGKWTTYRSMAEDTVDAAVAVGDLTPARGCVTHDMPLVGAERFEPEGHARLRSVHGLPEDVALHLHRAYGDRAEDVARLAADGLGQRLAPGHPYLEAEVVYARDVELACTADDVLARRLRLAFLDAAAAESARPRVEELLTREDTAPLAAGEARRSACRRRPPGAEPRAASDPSSGHAARALAVLDRTGSARYLGAPGALARP